MRAYTSKEELKDEIKKTYTKFIAEFDNIPEEMKDLRAEDVDRTPAENLAYKVGWTTLVLKWEQDERNGLEVKTPSDQFKWNQLGELYQWFTDTYAGLSLHELRTKLDTNIQRILWDDRRHDWRGSLCSPQTQVGRRGDKICGMGSL